MFIMTIDPNEVPAVPLEPEPVVEFIPEFKIVKTSSEMPEGWRMMSAADYYKYEDICRPMIPEWGIAQLTDGKIDGKGYGNKFTPGATSGSMFIMTIDPN